MFSSTDGLHHGRTSVLEGPRDPRRTSPSTPDSTSLPRVSYLAPPPLPPMPPLFVVNGTRALGPEVCTRDGRAPAPPRQGGPPTHRLTSGLRWSEASTRSSTRLFLARAKSQWRGVPLRRRTPVWSAPGRDCYGRSRRTGTDLTSSPGSPRRPRRRYTPSEVGEGSDGRRPVKHRSWAHWFGKGSGRPFPVQITVCLRLGRPYRGLFR